MSSGGTKLNRPKRGIDVACSKNEMAIVKIYSWSCCNLQDYIIDSTTIAFIYVENK